MSVITVILDNAQDTYSTPTIEDFQLWVDTATQSANISIADSIEEICIRIISSKESASLNETFRHKTGPTNVLSFHYEPTPELPPETLGDLAICAELVEQEAQTQHKSLKAHWAHLTLHGVLHLLGFDHIKDEDANTMEQLEISMMNTLNYPNPYEELTHD